MVFHVQPLTFYNSHTQEMNINVPVTQPDLNLSSPSNTLCSNITLEFASRTAKLLAAPLQDLAQRSRRRRAQKDPDFTLVERTSSTQNDFGSTVVERTRSVCIPRNLEISIAESCFRKFKEFSLEELQVATDGFRDRSRIGAGGFGTVYKGILIDGSTVAVKRRDFDSNQGKDELLREVEVSSMAIHRNLLQLYGYCITSKELLLVYPFMANGSLDSFLSSGHPESVEPQQGPLTWPTRKKIALGIAKVLAYLHEGCHRRIVHRDIKPPNILLNHNLEPLISDLGIARVMTEPSERLTTELLDSDQVVGETTRVLGTYGYAAPEYVATGLLSEKSDVYAFGITILQLAFGCKTCRRPNFYIRDWVMELVRSGRLKHAVKQIRQGEKHVKSEVKNLIKVGLVCTHVRPELRPKMTQVISMLEGAAIVRKKEYMYA